MATEGFQYITCDERLFRGRFQTPLANQDTKRRFRRGLETTACVLESFRKLIRPTDCSFRIVDKSTSEVCQERLKSEEGMTQGQIIEKMRETTEPLERPQFVSFDIQASVRITLSDGVHYVPNRDGQSVIRSVSGDTESMQTPLAIHISQTGVHRPCRTEVIDIVGHSKHWLDGDLDRFHLPAATPLATIDQCRLEAALSRLYDGIEPVQLSFDTFENTEGWHTPEQVVPGCESLQLRHSVEWVLENFSQQRADDTIEFEYIGDELYPNVNGAFGRDPDKKFDVFFRQGFPDDHFVTGATAIVAYPEDQTVFRKQSTNKWEIISS